MVVTKTELKQKINEAKELQALVRAMKAVSRTNIGQYENAVQALKDYQNTVEQGLALFLKKSNLISTLKRKEKKIKARSISVIIFGTNQGLVGRFNDDIVSYAAKILPALLKKPEIWAIGQRVYTRLQNVGLPPSTLFNTPNAVSEISSLIDQILTSSLHLIGEKKIIELHLIFNCITTKPNYTIERQRLLPFEKNKLDELIDKPWPTKKIPEILGDEMTMFRAFIREYLFVSLYRACSESLAAENMTRLLAMERAEKNIDELLNDLQREFFQIRQNSINEEIFDLISGYEASQTDIKR